MTNITLYKNFPYILQATDSNKKHEFVTLEIRIKDRCEMESRMKGKKTLVWAHRGASKYAPENTLPAFQKAIEMGADGIELDVQMTKDNQCVVIHDETVKRVSNGTVWVKDSTLEELREFDFGKGFTEYGKVRIPTLEEVLQLVVPSGRTINID